jgi:hypothetical protein
MTTTTEPAPSRDRTRTWAVTLDNGRRKLINAVYFKAEDDLTVFKDAHGKAVSAVATNRIVSIDREDHADVPVTINLAGTVLTEAELNAVIEAETKRHRLDGR